MMILDKNGGHVPSEIFGDSLARYVDMMYGEYVDGAVKITKKEVAEGQTANWDRDRTGRSRSFRLGQLRRREWYRHDNCGRSSCL